MEHFKLVSETHKFGERLAIYTIGGQEYLATRIVTLKGKEYQEMVIADPCSAGRLYAKMIDGDFILLEDSDIDLALRVKYAIDPRSVFGTFILDGHFYLDEDEFAIENGILYIYDKVKRDYFNKTVSSTVALDRVSIPNFEKGEL